MPTESFLEVTLFVADVRRSMEFYDAIGLGMFDYEFDAVQYHADGGIGVTALQLWPAGDRPVSRVQLGFRVKDLRVVAEALSAQGVDFELPMRHRLRTLDPDGNSVHLSEIAPNSGAQQVPGYAPTNDEPGQ